MTLEEAKAIAAIVQTADGGCPSCVGSLTDGLAEAFPQFVWTAREKTDSDARVEEFFDPMMRVEVVLTKREHDRQVQEVLSP